MTLDSAVAQVLDRRTDIDSDDEDALISQLESEESDSTLSHLRESRLQQLHQEFQRAKILKETQHGTYTEIKSESDLLDITTKTKLCVVHFFKPDFSRCRYMDSKLSVLAERHVDTRFVGMNVDNAPFLVVKLGVKVLPCVICFVDGISVDRVIGFEGIGYKPDEFTVGELEKRLLSCGVLVRSKMLAKEDGARRRVQKEREREEGFDDDEWD